ncbi:hypothetical protein ANO14919_134100 [Xylariales sp. No.14919]|nr:hypothetical protein ANO14919_134100 [Xylariales sp. No.14919]
MPKYRFAQPPRGFPSSSQRKMPKNRLVPSPRKFRPSRRILTSAHSPTVNSPASGDDDLWEGRGVAEYLGSLHDVGFPDLPYSKVRVVSWKLANPAVPPTQLEGIITSKERELVEEELVGKGKKYSGIFRITSTFKGPKGREFTIGGTAFAIGKSYAATSAHLVWNQKLGPAKSVVLHGDERSDGIAIGGKKCVAAACHVEWAKSYRVENDFCVVSVAEPFSAGVYTYRVRRLAEEPSSFDGVVIGFPSDLPADYPGKRLIKCSDIVESSGTGTLFRVKHKVNTFVAGNSGSPVFSGEEVFAIHSRYIDESKKNYATPIDRNGNMIDQFRGVLSYTKDKCSALLQGASYLGAAKHTGYHTQEILVFGEDTITPATEGVVL